MAGVGAGDFLRQEQGLDTLLQERGANLSGGQCQRPALARGLLHDSPIYIFDEAASNIDADSENHIVSLIQALAWKKTVIMISHRLASIREADNICVLATLTVPLTGVIVHKPASTVFLLLGLVHIFTAKRKSKLGLFLPALVIAAFASGILGMIPDEYPVVLGLHKLLSIGSVFALGLHSAAYFRRKRGKGLTSFPSHVTFYIENAKCPCHRMEAGENREPGENPGRYRRCMRGGAGRDESRSLGFFLRRLPGCL